MLNFYYDQQFVINQNLLAVLCSMLCVVVWYVLNAGMLLLINRPQSLKYLFYVEVVKPILHNPYRS